MVGLNLSVLVKELLTNLLFYKGLGLWILSLLSQFFLVIKLLVSIHIHLVDHHTVSRHNHSLLDLDDVSNNKILVWKSHGSALLSSEDSAGLLLLKLQNLKQLCLPGVVANGLNKGSEQDGEVN